SPKLKPFWQSVNEPLPVLEYLSSALLSSEYERALSRALAMPECPVVPFFGAFLRELREVLTSITKKPKSNSEVSMVSFVKNEFSNDNVASVKFSD
ncbi:hypothetical protein PV325_013556, partial [Microctonus aethiopoides]